MEILNNIWIALSTPNEIIMNIIFVIGGIVENFLTMHLFLSIFNISSSKARKCLFVVSVTSVSIFTMYIISNPFNIFINYIINVFLIFYIFKLSIIKSIISTIVPIVIYGLLGSLFSNPYLTLLHISSNDIVTIPIYRIGYLFIMYSVICIIIFCVKYRHFTLKSLEDNLLNSLIIVR